MLSISTDYVADSGCPEPYLRRIARAGFSHIHWCHQWNTDFFYSLPELNAIAGWLDELHLKMLDIHASAGVEKQWFSIREYERQAGIELVKNRIEMAARFSSEVIVLHIPPEPDEAAAREIFSANVRKSLDALEPFARERKVRIALENLMNNNVGTIIKLLAEYRPDYLGFCYDSGHGNAAGNGLDYLESLKGRLIALHLHDSVDKLDHNLLFSGTVDWPRLARIIAESAYAKCVNMELTMRRTEIEDEAVFLQKAFETGMIFSLMIENEIKR